MPQKKFLEQIADYYTQKHRTDDLADITFIFPNKRSALFLKHYIQQHVENEYVLMPRFVTFSWFAAQMAKVSEANHFELLFLLYNIYKEVVISESLEKGNPTEFDKFIFWGDMILEDFDEIDRSLADASKLYSNLRGMREITSDYLTEDQKQIIERFWGHTNLTQHIEGFWHHVSWNNDGKEDSKIVRKFMALWEILAPIYRQFKERLEEARMATPGMVMRKALEAVKNTGYDILSRHKYVFVGHADISNAEMAIMERLKDVGCADFFWDLASPLFFDGENIDETNIAVRFVKRLAERFPMPDDFALSPVKTMPKVDIIGVPSSVGQTKVAGKIIAGLKKDNKFDEKEVFDTAIILPNASQLMPLMLSLPDDLPGLNITMGLPYSTTTFATLFSAIISMQRHSRKNRNEVVTFFYKDVLEILIHPHIQLIAREKATLARQYIYDKRLFNVEYPVLVELLGDISFIFTPIGNINDVNHCYAYIEGLIKGLKNLLSDKQNFKNSAELEILDYFDTQISDLKDLVARYSVKMQESTFLTMFERILMSKNINVEGTPLTGLQIMGVLETRGIDFNNIIFLDVNERSLPQKDYVRTMIPNNIRRGYGLPSIEHTESFYSYYFFRAIGRASNVTLLYDSRPPGKGRGEMSRYLEQLLYVHNAGNITHSTVNLSGIVPDTRKIVIEKSHKGVMDKINKFKQPGGVKLSASALKQYQKCRLAFYLGYVNNLRDDDEPTDYMDAAKLGDIFHKTACRMFEPYKGKKITEDILDKISDEENVKRIITSEIAALHGLDPDNATQSDLNAEGLLIMSNIKQQIHSMIEAEKDAYLKGLGDFTYVDGEMDVVGPWKVGDHEFNFRMQIDRVDRIDDKTLRFIDYKTGVDDTKVGNYFSNLFAGKHEKSAIFQLLTYAAAYKGLVDKSDDIVLSLHVLRDIVKSGKIAPIKYPNRKGVVPYSSVEDEFYPLFKQMIDEIFDETTPFDQCEDIANCKYCSFLTVCGRNLPVENYHL